MKKVITLVVMSYLLIVVAPTATGQTATPSAKPLPTKTVGQVEEQSKKFIDKLASKVAELNLVEKRGIIGTVGNMSDLQFTVTDLNKEPFIIDVDELTKFASPSAETDSSFGISDLSRGDTIGVLGLYNKQSRRTLARFIEILVLPKVISGAVSSVNEDDFSIEVLGDDGTLYTVDIETSTKSSSFSKESGLIRSGFSKFSPEQHIMVRGFPSKSDSKRISASRIILFPEIPKNPKLNSLQPTVQNTIASASPTLKSAR